mmetsp:Transcript_37054/g.42278  ORF Transcript_37054/g.42278 Transcript_37054/m.42278 type:complete len:376 (-) Transcript_37054:110-1237(-)
MSTRNEEESTSLGLGYYSESFNANTESFEDSNLDDMMKHYFQQCMEYHKEQEGLEQKRKEEANELLFVKEENNLSMQFLNDGISEKNIKAINESNINIVEEKDTKEAAIQLEASIVKAKAIVQKFQLSSSVQLTKKDHPPNYYLLQRRQFYAKERDRFEKALLKNFAYVANREEQRLEQKLEQIHQNRQLEQSLLRQEEIKRWKTKQRILQGIGIPTKKRQRQNNKNEKEEQQTASIYVSNLPNHEDCNSILRTLFESYGTIRKIHQYRNKETNEFKSDALIVYSLLNSTNHHTDEFLQSICQQLNGCQMPCGTMIHVEPAIPNHHSHNSRSKEQYLQSTKTTKATTPKISDEIVAGSNTLESSGDLDDFFASLV